MLKEHSKPGRLPANNVLLKLFVFLILWLSVFALSCEDVINIDLDRVEPRVVIEGNITEGWPHLVRVSKTTDFYEPVEFPAVSGAVVTISDNEGHSEYFIETEPGFYHGFDIQGVPGRTYYLTVTIEDATYAAVSTMPLPVVIDSLGYEYQEGDDFEDEGYMLHCYFNDPVNQDDYCRFKVWENGGFKDDIYLYDGEWSDGNEIDYSFFWKLFLPESELIVVLMSIDEATFDYFSTLGPAEATVDGELPHGVPANPNTNLTNGALGYFSAFSISVDSLTLPPGP